MNSKLRKQFRIKKKEILAEEKADKAFLDKYALDIALLPASKADAAIASSIAFDAHAGKTCPISPLTTRSPR